MDKIRLCARCGRGFACNVQTGDDCCYFCPDKIDTNIKKTKHVIITLHFSMSMTSFPITYKLDATGEDEYERYMHVIEQLNEMGCYLNWCGQENPILFYKEF